MSSFLPSDSADIEITVEYRDAVQDKRNLLYLFLKDPTGDLVDGRFSARIPPLDELLYWSFDADGRRRLDANSVDLLRLPALTCRINTGGSSWTARQYKSLQEAHKAKGFHPDGADVARFEECADSDAEWILVGNTRERRANTVVFHTPFSQFN
ncbi:hypothetical protein C8R47DRAFT_1229958 [Mycena vitilis]|nr:hypothetical protein C8R47DRAFT_1229958 [Mycena vitilis]